VSPTFQQLTFSQCRDVADEAFAQYWPSRTIPVDIDHIIEYGIPLEIIPLKGLRNELDIYGFLSNDRGTLFLDSSMMVTQKFEAILRFTMAHELGHFFLHREFYEANPITSAHDWEALLAQIDGANLLSYEDQADEFAGRLLVPKDKLVEEIIKLSDDLQDFYKKLVSFTIKEEIQLILVILISERLSPVFNVPFDVMQQRLQREPIDPLHFIKT
jgi:hypothetical protein